MAPRADETGLAVGVLGPLDVRVGGEPVTLPGVRQRALLVALTLGRGTVVSADVLTGQVFDGADAGSRSALQTCVKRLRQALGAAAARIHTHPPGYLLDVSAIDADRFTALLVDRSGESPADVLDRLDAALGLWRGPAYAEFADGFARGEAARLEHLRASARERRVEVLLDLGRADDAVAAATGMVAADPGRERAVALLVTGLAASGRIPAALAAYRSHVDWMCDELGLDPSAELSDLHGRVLRGEIPRVGVHPDTVRRVDNVSGCTSTTSGLVGRDADLARARELLATSRLVTLVGPGGVGKTRLARELYARTTAAAWVDLAALTDPSAVPHAVAEAVGLTVDPGTPLARTIGRWATGSGCLIVLDNCEHLLDAVADLITTVLGGGGDRGARVLATSRERIDLPGERPLVVAPLDLPAPGVADPDAPAVRLFLDRAAEVDADFAIDTGNAVGSTSTGSAGTGTHTGGARGTGSGRSTVDGMLARITGICRSLDGLPLAIELAAARVGTLTVDDLADRLDARFELLVGARRGGDPRHQTLRAVIDWSYDLLSEPERLLFARLHVFAAAFDIAAVEAVATDERVPVDRVAHLLGRLSEQSMITRPGHAGVGRYRLLDTLREYAAGRLPAGEVDRLRRRHARYVVELAERVAYGLSGPSEVDCATLLEQWLDDARAAWSWVRDAGETDLAVRLVAALTPYAYWRVRLDVLAWGEWVAAHVPAHPRLPVAFAAAASGAWMAGRPDEGREYARRGIEVAGGEHEPAAVPALEAYGDTGLVTGDLAGALWAYRAEAALTGAGTAAHAIALGNEALALAYGDDPAAWSVARRAVGEARAGGNPTAIAMTRYAEGEAAAEEDPMAALDALAEASSVATGSGSRFVAGLALTATVALRGRHGPPAESLALFRDAIAHWRVSANRALLGTALRNLVMLLVRTGRDADAVALAATMRHDGPTPTYGAEAERITRALAAARRRLSPADYDAAWTAGAKRGMDDAADIAQRLLAGPVL